MRILSNETDLLSEPVFTRVSVSIAEFEVLAREERIRLIVDRFPATNFRGLVLETADGSMAAVATRPEKTLSQKNNEEST